MRKNKTDEPDPVVEGLWHLLPEVELLTAQTELEDLLEAALDEGEPIEADEQFEAEEQFWRDRELIYDEHNVRNHTDHRIPFFWTAAHALILHILHIWQFPVAPLMLIIYNPVMS